MLDYLKHFLRGDDVFKKLRASEARFRALADSTLNAFVFADTTGTITYINKSGTKMFGWTDQELIGKNVIVLIPDRYREIHLAHFARFQTTGKMATDGQALEVEALRHDGSEIYVAISLSCWPEAGGLMVGAIIKDISHRKRNEENLRRQHQQLLIQMEKRSLLEQEIASLHALHERHSSQISDTAAAIDKLNGIANNLSKILETHERENHEGASVAG